MLGFPDINCGRNRDGSDRDWAENRARGKPRFTGCEGIAGAGCIVGRFSSINQFIVQSAIREAERIVRQEQVIRLSLRDTQAFWQALENPPKPNAALLAAAKRYRDTVVPE